jgi:hypothetical protein
MWGFRVLGSDDGVFDLAVALLLHSRGGGDKAVQPREVEQQTEPTHAARADLDTDQMESQNQAMEQGTSRSTVKKCGHFGTAIERVMPGLPRLQGASGHLKLLGGLTLGETLRVQIEIWREPIGPLEAVPEVMAVAWVAVWHIEYSAHSDLPLEPLPNGKKKMLAKHGEVALRSQPGGVTIHPVTERPSLIKWPTL